MLYRIYMFLGDTFERVVASSGIFRKWSLSQIRGNVNFIRTFRLCHRQDPLSPDMQNFSFRFRPYSDFDNYFLRVFATRAVEGHFLWQIILGVSAVFLLVGTSACATYFASSHSCVMLFALRAGCLAIRLGAVRRAIGRSVFRCLHQKHGIVPLFLILEILLHIIILFCNFIFFCIFFHFSWWYASLLQGSCTENHQDCLLNGFWRFSGAY